MMAAPLPKGVWREVAEVAVKRTWAVRTKSSAGKKWGVDEPVWDVLLGMKGDDKMMGDKMMFLRR